ncbi:MAG TPA: OB-fold nucleic acid binding domain-containing protein, partial [Chitinophagaceae bacterium]|nr:OB-fold nucleic acid binding domain-containing protein [Chitinophagaceae bacterium]
DMTVLISARKNPIGSIADLLNAGLTKATLKRLADADAFRSIGLDRREALWEISACNDHPTGIFSGQTNVEEKVSLPAMKDSEHVVHDYAATSLSLKAHPVSFVREKLEQIHIVPTKQLASLKDGDTVKVAGLVLVRQRPGTAKGVCFITIEDETGNANLVVFENLFDKYRKEILSSRLLMVEGKLQIEGEVIHVIVQHCYNLSKLLLHLTAPQNDNPTLHTLSPANLKSSPPNSSRNKKQPLLIQEEIFSKGRNFK